MLRRVPYLQVELVTPERFAAVVAEVRALVALTLQHEAGAAGQAGQRQDEGVDGEGQQRTGTAATPADSARRVEVRGVTSTLCNQPVQVTALRQDTWAKSCFAF